MPGTDYYTGSISERIRQLAEHHYDSPTRHLSRYEYELLLRAAEILDQQRRSK